MKKIFYYVGIALAAGCLVCYFIPTTFKSGFWTVTNSYFNEMLLSFQNGTGEEIFAGIFTLIIMIFSILALVFVLIKKSIPAIVFAALAGVLIMTLNIGFVRILFVILSILLIASQICYMVFDKKENAAIKEPVSQANDASNQNNNF